MSIFNQQKRRLKNYMRKIFSFSSDMHEEKVIFKVKNHSKLYFNELLDLNKYPVNFIL